MLVSSEATHTCKVATKDQPEMAYCLTKAQSQQLLSVLWWKSSSWQRKQIYSIKPTRILLWWALGSHSAQSDCDSDKGRTFLCLEMYHNWHCTMTTVCNTDSKSLQSTTLWPRYHSLYQKWGWTDKLIKVLEIFFYQNINIWIFILNIIDSYEFKKKIQFMSKLELNHVMVGWTDQQFTLEVH